MSYLAFRLRIKYLQAKLLKGGGGPNELDVCSILVIS